MWDIIKTMLASLWVKKSYRPILIFMLVCFSYRIFKDIVVFSQYEMMPATFVKMNTDGSLRFLYMKNEQDITSAEYQIPTLRTTNKCEREFFRTIYEPMVIREIKMSKDKKFILNFKNKFWNPSGEVSFYDGYGKEKKLFEYLFENEILIKKGDKERDYCAFLRKYHKNDV